MSKDLKQKDSEIKQKTKDCKMIEKLKEEAFYKELIAKQEKVNVLIIYSKGSEQ